MSRCLERLKARNERLNGALVRRKGESEQLSMSLSRQEADGSALHMALAYWCVCCCLHLCLTLHDPGSGLSPFGISRLLLKLILKLFSLFDIVNLDLWPLRLALGACVCVSGMLIIAF